ncbi:DUF2933 domain-containing protein [Bacillus sp. 1NLA3E]|uniref:DUF2933 domain-containing protein n=1 Tax=Bacillus sp. 1NLA3E TaxID=666686 RepID=UPI000247ED6B|nr:DUF2933 domain-containing protein [Bacillus sp. 1NLA3E]AGK55647.1 hypothetical protein B1NLA3E_19515 [Bacillus sp. 1NLA3E]
MEWLQFLLVLLCPLMMIFCMKGHMGGHKQNHDLHNLNDLDKKVGNLLDENAKLRKEVADLSILVKKES